MENQMIFQRYELKYLLTKQQRDQILKAAEPYVSADRFGHSDIRNLYYDTPNYRLIRESLEKPVYKEKLRIRSYGRASGEDAVFVELKKKYESIVYKRRIELPLEDAVCGLAGSAPLPECQVAKEIQSALQYYNALHPRVFLSYERDAFHTIDGTDVRLTFDENIRYRTEMLTLDSDAWGIPLLSSDTILMELKLPGVMPLWLAQTLSQMGIYKTTFSKYGAAYLQMQADNLKGALQYA